MTSRRLPPPRHMSREIFGKVGVMEFGLNATRNVTARRRQCWVNVERVCYGSVAAFHHSANLRVQLRRPSCRQFFISNASNSLSHPARTPNSRLTNSCQLISDYINSIPVVGYTPGIGLYTRYESALRPARDKK